jgi:hypothetical protein
MGPFTFQRSIPVGVSDINTTAAICVRLDCLVAAHSNVRKLENGYLHCPEVLFHCIKNGMVEDALAKYVQLFAIWKIKAFLKT